MATAVLLAAGSGERFSREVPKQLLKVAGITVIEHALRAFESHEDITDIIIVTRDDLLGEVSELVDGKFTKISKIVSGGATRSDSSKAAISAIDAGDQEKILMHDAVRPLVTEKIISDCVLALDKYDAIDVAIPTSDTIIEISNGNIESIPQRDKLRRGQTPQGFRLGVLRKAYDLLNQEENFHPTDDCGVVAHFLPTIAIGVVAGSEVNIKLTYPIDSFLADKLFQLRSAQINPVERESLQASFEGKTVLIFGGTYGIGASIGSQAEILGANVEVFSRSSTGTDVQKIESVRKALSQTQEKTGRIDFVINTAGLLKISRLNELTDNDVQDLIGANYLGAVNVARASYEYLQDTKGKLLLFASSSYTRGRANYSLYSSSKAAVVNLVQALSDEWVEMGLSINCINPERTNTPMRVENFGSEDPKTLLDASVVAETSLQVLASDLSGSIIDVRQ